MKTTIQTLPSYRVNTENCHQLNLKVDFFYFFTHSQVESVLARCSYNNHIKIHLSLNINMFWNSVTIIIIIVSFIHLFWMAFISKNEKKENYKNGNVMNLYWFSWINCVKTGESTETYREAHYFARLAYWVGLTYSQSYVLE